MVVRNKKPICSHQQPPPVLVRNKKTHLEPPTKNAWLSARETKKPHPEKKRKRKKDKKKKAPLVASSKKKKSHQQPPPVVVRNKKPICSHQQPPPVLVRNKKTHPEPSTKNAWLSATRETKKPHPEKRKKRKAKKSPTGS